MSMQSEAFRGYNGTFSTNRSRMLERIFDAWLDMRGSCRRLIAENPSEGRIVFMVVLSDLIFFLSWTIKTVVAPMSSAAHLIPIEISLWLVAALMVRTAFMYLISFIIFCVAKIFKGRGSYYETRVCVFWAALVSAPFGFIAALVTVSMYGLEDYIPFFQNEWISLPPYWLGVIPFVWLISAGISESHKFKNSSPVFMVMTLLSLAGLIGIFYLKVNGAV
ncbi:MAG: YIP1 family protein [Rhodobacterales bacterium]